MDSRLQSRIILFGMTLSLNRLTGIVIIRKRCSMLTWDFFKTTCWEKNRMLTWARENVVLKKIPCQHEIFFFPHGILKKIPC